MVPRRIILMTSGGVYASRLATELSVQGVELAGVIITSQKAVSHRKRAIRCFLNPGKSILRLLRRVQASESQRSLSPWEQFSPRVYRPGELNSAAARSLLRELRADHVLLGGAGVLESETIEAASCPIWNAHPALLPFCRGIDVVANAVLREVAIGITLHRVDPGIDTGPHVERRLVPVYSYDTLNSLRAKANYLCTRQLASFARQLSQGANPPLHDERCRSKYCERLPEDVEGDVAKDILEGKAVALYEEWRTALSGDVVPAGVSKLPPSKVRWVTAT